MNLMVLEFCGLGNSVLLSNIFYLSSHNNITFIGDDRYGGLSIHRDNIHLKKIINIKKKNIYSIIRHIKIQNYIIIPFTSNPSIIFTFLLFFFAKEKFYISNKYFKDMNFFKLKIVNLILKVKKKFNKNFFLKEINFDEQENERDINFKFIKDINYKKKLINEKIKFNYNENSNIIENYNLKIDKYFVIQPYANNGSKSAKIWPEKMFVSLFNLLVKNFPDHQIVLVGDKSDLKNSKNKFSLDKVLNLIGKTNFDDLISLIKNSSNIICHDSSILHISDSLNKKNISIFGPTNFKKNRPFGKNSKSLFKNYPCSPCIGWSKSGLYHTNEVQALQLCKYNHKCMKNIKPHNILDAIIEMY